MSPTAATRIVPPGRRRDGGGGGTGHAWWCTRRQGRRDRGRGRWWRGRGDDVVGVDGRGDVGLDLELGRGGGLAAGELAGRLRLCSGSVTPTNANNDVASESSSDPPLAMAGLLSSSSVTSISTHSSAPMAPE